MPISILKLLSSTEFRSGEAISRELGISRASVHNLMERAKQLGVDVQAVRGKGYRLAEPYSWLELDRLAARLAERGYRLHLHEQVDSTNSRLLDLAQQGQCHKCVVAAEWQSQGRGRRGRHWWAPLGGGLTFSLLWHFQRPLTALSGLSLAVGVGLARALRGMGVAEARLKWPNDILVEGRKLAGILIETHGDVLSAASAVIGIGINVRAVPEGEASRGFEPVALEDALGRLPDRNEVLIALLHELDGVLKVFDVQGFVPFVAEWHALHAWQGRPVQVVGAGGHDVLQGIALGVDEAGVLRLETAEGLRLIHSGEVSLRPGVAK
jgi:BirA family biotin operon repressor/biotin-[acetyl-CoA-carboxylase] ligase